MLHFTELFRPVDPPVGLPAPHPDGATEPAPTAPNSPAAAHDPQLGSVGKVAEQLHRWGVRAGIPQVKLCAFAGDHGLELPGIGTLPTASAHPPQSVEAATQLANGGGMVGALAAQQQVPVQVIDVNLPSDAAGVTPDTRITQGTSRSIDTDALEREQVLDALVLGASIADQAIDTGADMLIPTTIAPRAHVLSEALVGTTTGLEPLAVHGFLGVDDTIWSAELTCVRDLMFRTRQHRYATLNLLGAIGSAELAALVGFLVRAASRRTPVLLDTLPEATCALLANQIAPGAAAWFLATQLTRYPAHKIALQQVGCTALYALNVPHGQGLGALTALPLLRAVTAQAPHASRLP